MSQDLNGTETEAASCEEWLELESWVRIRFDMLGYSWQHPKIQAFLSKVSELVGHPCRHGRDLPIEAYRSLNKRLLEEIDANATQQDRNS